MKIFIEQIDFVIEMIQMQMLVFNFTLMSCVLPSLITFRVTVSPGFCSRINKFLNLYHLLFVYHLFQ